MRIVTPDWIRRGESVPGEDDLFYCRRSERTFSSRAYHDTSCEFCKCKNFVRGR